MQDVLQRYWLWFCHPPYILLSRLAIIGIISAKENQTLHFFSLVRSKIETFQKCGPEILWLWDVFYYLLVGCHALIINQSVIIAAREPGVIFLLSSLVNNWDHPNKWAREYCGCGVSSMIYLGELSHRETLMRTNNFARIKSLSLSVELTSFAFFSYKHKGGVRIIKMEI